MNPTASRDPGLCFLRPEKVGNAKRLAACAILGFIPLTFIPLALGYAVSHDTSMRIAENSTQIILVALCLFILCAGRVSFSFDTRAAVGVAFCVGIAQMVAVSHSFSDEKNYIMPAVFPFFLLAGPIALSLARDIEVERMGGYVARIGGFLLWFFCLECVTRYVFSAFVGANLDVGVFQTQEVGADWFYRYKFSVFYADANSVGLALLCLTAVILAFRQYFKKWQVFLAFGLIGATFSRASIAAAICQLIIYKFWRWRRWILAAIVVSVPVLVLLLFTAYTTEGPGSLTDYDGSFASKFLILQKMVGLLADADGLQKLVGIGSGNTEGLIGIAAHSIVAGFALELGLVGSILVIAYVWLLSRGSSKAIFLLIVPIVINGISLVLTSMPYFYVTLGLLGAVTDDRIRNWGREPVLTGSLNSAPQPLTQ